MLKNTSKILSWIISCCILLGLFVTAIPVNRIYAATAAFDTDASREYRFYYISVPSENIPQKDIAVEVDSFCADEPVNIPVMIEEEGLYRFGMEYTAEEKSTSSLEASLFIDESLPFSECENLLFPLQWTLPDEIRTDGAGNEFSPEAERSSDSIFHWATDSSGWSAEEYLFYFSKGEHVITILSVSDDFWLKGIRLAAPEAVVSYADSPFNLPDETTEDDEIVIEAENADNLSEYWLVPKSDNTSALLSPRCDTTDKINYIGGSNWKNPGETISWKVFVNHTGYYQLGFCCKQSEVINASTYRTLRIDGELPFEEASEIAFPYSTKWQNVTFAENSGTPYRIYLTAGEHLLSLTVTSGPLYEVGLLLKETVALLGDIYMDITMITGETVDHYRDYDLFDSIGDLEDRMNQCLDNLNAVSESLSLLGNQQTGSYDSSIRSMLQILEKMMENRYTAHRYLSDYYSKYCSLASVLNEMRSMPLSLDRIYLVPCGSEMVYDKTGFFKQMLFSMGKFLQSFSADYNTVSGADSEQDGLTVWVNWGRDQAQVLNALVQSSFTPQSGIHVEIKVVNATMVQAVLSGNAPDCILQHSRSEPVNLAMRGVLLDLEQFDDLEEVLGRFQTGADVPYRYRGGLYALPDTQNFYLLFYRKDIFENLGLTVPETWEQYITTVKILSRNNLQSWMHYTQITAANQVDAGVGSLNLFPTMLLQRGLSLYAGDNRSTLLSSSEVIQTFEYWTDFYTKLKAPVTLSFYNRFRTGTCPIGIDPYTTYTTLKAAAPEIDGLWGVAPVPGVKEEDGSISHTSTGGGTGCAILKSTQNPQAAWTFLKWWTSAETQYSYTQNVEAVLGPTGRVAVSNIEAFRKMSWDSQMKEDILFAWSQVKEIPEIPGSYYVSRSIDLSFWSVVNENRNPKDVLLEKSVEIDNEIERKWQQYANRGS